LECQRADTDYYRDEQITILTYTALGLAHTLNISKVPHDTVKLLGKDTLPREHRHAHRKAQASETKGSHTLEEQRTYIGLFCILAL
jgi:hypothetical protein